MAKWWGKWKFYGIFLSSVLRPQHAQYTVPSLIGPSLGIVVWSAATKCHCCSLDHLLNKVWVLNITGQLCNWAQILARMLWGPTATAFKKFATARNAEKSLTPWRAWSCARRLPLRLRKLFNHASVPASYLWFRPRTGSYTIHNLANRMVKSHAEQCKVKQNALKTMMRDGICTWSHMHMHAYTHTHLWTFKTTVCCVRGLTQPTCAFPSI